jgi:hypothetical protein
LIAVIVVSDVFLNLCLALLVDFCQKTSNLASVKIPPAKVLDQTTFAGFLDGAGSAVEEVGVAIPVLGRLICVIIAQPLLLGSLDLHGLGDVLEGERVLFI